MSIETISIIGSGNVAFHLAKMLSGSYRLLSVHSRNKQEGKKLAELNFAYFAEDIEDLLESDLLFVCVNDDQIQDVISQIPQSQKIAYTSGSVHLKHFKEWGDCGVIYPLQSFSKNNQLDYFNIPFFIEANNEPFAQELFDLAWNFSRKVVFLSSDDRVKLHLAAVMVNNFTNHIFQIAHDYLKSCSIEFEYLYPLIQETAQKAIRQSPAEVQTGPAVRNDQNTIQKHLDMLPPHLQEIYKLMSDHIYQTHKKS